MEPISARHPNGEERTGKVYMYIDFLAMWQPISNLRDDNGIDADSYVKLMYAVREASITNRFNRKAIKHEDLLSALAGVQLPPDVWVKVWRALGEGIASGILVARE
jgi:hypothetical protein